MDTVNWGGHEFNIFAKAAAWNEVAGVYIFAGLSSSLEWVAIYIGQTDNFRNRIPQHEQWSPAMLLGATHVHAMVVPQEATRLQIERLLIATYQPMLNVQLKQTSDSDAS
jgi:excinuclease UvrABC nuclease subunit